MLSDFIHCQQAMQRAGVRRLLVISGEAEWCRQQAQLLRSALPGDWLWIATEGEASYPPTYYPTKQARNLLGQTYLHAVFDATGGLAVDALAAVSGTLSAGSWLLLLVPPWQQWTTHADHDSLRWSEQSFPIATPRFITHFCQQLSTDNSAIIWQQGTELAIPPLPCYPVWQPATGAPTLQQNQLLQQLQHATSGVWVVTSARGRGKSALAGMFVAQQAGACWLTAPNHQATTTLRQWAGERLTFMAPDALLAWCRQHSTAAIDWLLIDEAAAIPTPLLRELISYFQRVLITTTVQGYEGTGRGFLLKFCAALPEWRDLRLSNPIRWAEHDPLEKLLDRTLFFREHSITVQPSVCDRAPSIQSITQDDWLTNPGLFADFYGLLTSAHYRTTPLDLRRIYDAPGMSFAAAMQGKNVLAAMWLVDEGRLPAALAHDVWAGRRRPRGSLVAQSLAAHAGQWRAPMLYSRRISRIAVDAAWRRQGIGQQLVAAEKQRAAEQGVDFLSVSFGYTELLWQFWQHCGFTLVRIGCHYEASSGCYAAMALLPLSHVGIQLCQEAQQQLLRDWPWLAPRLALTLPFPTAAKNNDITAADWRELAGFAYAQRSLEPALGALNRLLLVNTTPALALRAHLQQQQDEATCVQLFALSGKKTLLQRWRKEAADAMRQHNFVENERAYSWVQTFPQ